MRAQVFVFGHDLSSRTRKWLQRRYGDVNIHKVHVHCEKLSDVLLRVEATLDALWEQGADFSGRTTTVMSLPGLGTASAALIAAWAGVSGTLPVVLNLMRIGDGYGPSPELPILDLQSIRNNLGRIQRQRLNGVERLERPQLEPQRDPQQVA